MLQWTFLFIQVHLRSSLEEVSVHIRQAFGVARLASHVPCYGNMARILYRLLRFLCDTGSWRVGFVRYYMHRITSSTDISHPATHWCWPSCVSGRIPSQGRGTIPQLVHSYTASLSWSCWRTRRKTTLFRNILHPVGVHWIPWTWAS